ncbi:MAG: hypothetical protein ABGW81_10090 [Paracoccaceae bacterium]
MKNLIAITTLLLAASPALAGRPNLEFRLGLDYLTLEQSDIRGLNGMSLSYRVTQGYYGGASIYSAAIGTGGGFFVGGWELGKHTTITDNLFWDASIFIGGGGGASQVSGDGLMLRPQAHFGYDFGDYRIGVGASFVSVSGSDISTPAFTLTFTRPLNIELVGGHPTGGFAFRDVTRVNALTPIVRSYIPLNNKKRGGGELQNMWLMGAELTFAHDTNSESFIQASGVVYGDAEGYADWVLGRRYLWNIAPLDFYADIGVGIGGGGAVDTGGGLLISASVGAQIDTLEHLNLAVDLGAISSLNGDFTALTPAIKASYAFGTGLGGMPELVRWQASTGVTQLITSPEFRKLGAASTASPAMISAEVDVFLLKNTYLTGQAYTAFSGDAGGFQMGLLGIGYSYAVSEEISLSGEVFIGAAGGAGVNAKGGLLGGCKVEADYRLTDFTSLTLGLGQLQTLQSGGLHPLLASLGFKFPITTLH